MDCWKSSSLFALRPWSILSSLPSRRNCGTFSFRSSTIYERGDAVNFHVAVRSTERVRRASSPPSSTSSLVGFLAGTVIFSLRTVQAAAFPPFQGSKPSFSAKSSTSVRVISSSYPFSLSLPPRERERERERGLLPPQLMPGLSTPRECGGGLSPFTLPLLSLSPRLSERPQRTVPGRAAAL